MSVSVEKKLNPIKLLGGFLIFLFVVGCIEGTAHLITSNVWILKSTNDLSSTKWYLRWLNQVSMRETQHVTNYSIDQHHPFLGWSPKKNVRIVMHDGTVASFNSAGIRGVREYRFDKPSDVHRIAVIGDSFTFGEGVNDDETYSAQLEKKLPKTEVMNFAVHGYGIDQMLLRFEHKILPYKPDVVVFAFIFDDLYRAHVGFRDYQKPLFRLMDDGQLQLTNVPIPKPEELLEQSRWQSKTVLAAQLLYEGWRFKNYQNVAPEVLAHTVFTRVYQQAKEHAITPVFLFLPAGVEMMDFGTYNGGEKILFDFCQNTTAVCLSARPYLIDAYQAGARYDTNKHYSAETNAIIAAGLLKDLIKHQVIPNAR